MLKKGESEEKWLYFLQKNGKVFFPIRKSCNFVVETKFLPNMGHREVNAIN